MKKSVNLKRLLCYFLFQSHGTSRYRVNIKCKEPYKIDQIL